MVCRSRRQSLGIILYYSVCYYDMAVSFLESRTPSAVEVYQAFRDGTQSQSLTNGKSMSRIQIQGNPTTITNSAKTLSLNSEAMPYNANFNPPTSLHINSYPRIEVAFSPEPSCTHTHHNLDVKTSIADATTRNRTYLFNPASSPLNKSWSPGCGPESAYCQNVVKL